MVGIDLGTTNSAVAYVDTEKSASRIRTLLVPQLVAPGQVERRETLPSFSYQPAEGEFGPEMLRLPWEAGDRAGAGGEWVVGAFARDQGTLAPGRLISSAKSWLSHSGVDRTAELLPWHGAPDVARVSPVDASARYLRHVADAWNAEFPRHPLAEQDIVLTLPASFDEVARELTVKAAARAGLPRVVLIEEPQSAFYAWLNKHAEDWEQRVQPGQKILVCDIGGGTSDFTLIRVRRGEGGKVRFHRVAVGDHLILGGDNFDLALAHHLEQRLRAEEGSTLEPRQWAALVRACRAVKETLLGDDPPEQLTVNIPSTGARLIGGGRQIEVSRGEVAALLLEGFLPQVGLDDKPQRHRSGFQEFGLPYAPDPAITRCLAAFLTAHRHVALDESEPPADHDPARPDIVLFNGGLFASPVLRDRLLKVLRSWFANASQTADTWQPLVLDHDRLDLAVARGAAYYGMVRRGQGVRIAAGLARTYYIGVESAEPAEAASTASTASTDGRGRAVCLVPAGVEPGHDVELADRRFDLTIAEPVEFPLFYSSVRLTDKPGELLAVDREQMTPLPPIRTVLRTRRKSERGLVSVHLHARLTEIGTLELWCGETAGPRSWRLEFDVRSTTQTDIAAHQSAAEAEGVIDEETWQRCLALIEQTFGEEPTLKPAKLVIGLAEAVGASRNQWPTSLCRRIAETLMDFEPGRRLGQAHESRWLNLLGFCLRPGYGLAVDDWRVAQVWTTVQGKIVHPGPATRAEGWILWRRIAGGLTSGQQQAVAEPLLGMVRGLHRQLTTGKRRGGDATFTPRETAEIWRLLGSLELLPTDAKLELGRMLLDLLPKRKMEAVRPAIAWALGRIGARVPMYGPLNTVVPADAAGGWLPELMQHGGDDPSTLLAVMQMSRRTDDRYRDLSEKARAKAAAWLEREGAASHFVELVRSGGRLDVEEQSLVFGESLPKGLRLA